MAIGSRSGREESTAELLRRLTTLSVLGDRALIELARQATIFACSSGQQIEWRRADDVWSSIGVIEGTPAVAFLSQQGSGLPFLHLGAGALIDLGREGWGGVDATLATVVSHRALVCSLPHCALIHAVASSEEAIDRLTAEHQRWLCAVGGAASDRQHPRGERLRHTLWRRLRATPDGSIVLTHEQLAAEAGVTRSFATTEIGRLKRARVFDAEPKEHRIFDVDLDRLADDTSWEEDPQT